MSTQKQRDANLSNAQLSTGPKTPEGKSKASLNALKHGFCADDITLHDDPETAEQIAARVTRYIDHYLPQSPLEEATVHEIAFCEIRLEHFVRAETGLLNFHRQLAFQQHSFSDPAGNLFHKRAYVEGRVAEAQGGVTRIGPPQRQSAARPRWRSGR